MELVIIRDVPSTYAMTWFFIANTEGYDRIRINQEFRENGTLEIVAVENIAPSPVPGASRVLMRRGEHASPVEPHRAGGVFREAHAPTEEAVRKIREARKVKVALGDE